MIGEWTTTTLGVLTLISATISIFSTLRSNRLAREKFKLEKSKAELEKYQAKNEHRSSLIDDIGQVLASVREENSRLSKRVTELEDANRTLAAANAQLTERVTELEKDNVQLRHDYACLEERLGLEREAFDKTFRELEARVSGGGKLKEGE